jgi:hypothetical protein
MKETIRAVDAGMKEMDIILEINGRDVIVTTPYEKIAIPQKEFEKLMAAFLKEKKAEAKVEEVVEKQWTRKDRN